MAGNMIIWRALPNGRRPMAKRRRGMPDDLAPKSGSPADWLNWTTQQQAIASDPKRSAWVSANAGSGKTQYQKPSNPPIR